MIKRARQTSVAKALTLAFLIIALVSLVTVPVRPRVLTQGSNSFTAELTIRADQPKGIINRNIYGSFAEHLGRSIYEGIWVGEDSSIPNTHGIRNDVIGALKNMSLPVLRWPGGCYGDEYHWRDGIGPRDKRPHTINSSWGGVIETNAFGTHEFMDFCNMIGADPYISANVGSGTPQEMMDWIEYMTSATDSQLSNLRRQNGRDKPWKVKYWGIGNESWGCGGNMRPGYYADEFKRFATFAKSYSGNQIERIASGPSDQNYEWTDTLMSQAARQMQGLSLHYYTLPTGNWSKKGLAVGFGEAEWASTISRTLRMDEFIQRHSAIMDKYDPQKRVGLIVDEWGTWYDPEPGTNPSPLYQQNSVRDAIVAALNFNIFNQHSDRVTMAASAQTINVLQAVILTDKEKMVLTPTYHVFEMYKVHQGATLVPVLISAPEYKFDKTTAQAISASASRDKDGKLHLSVVNIDPNRPAQITVRIAGATANNVTGRVLTGTAMDSINTFDKPETVRPVALSGIKVQGDQVTMTIPSKSVVVVEIQ